MGLKEEYKDIWSFPSPPWWRVVPTNLTVNSKGLAVMGRGVALQAAEKYPWLRKRYGDSLKIEKGTTLWPDARLILLPVKGHWGDKASLSRIRRGCRRLAELAPGQIVIPRLGCGNGRLDWEEVRPIMEQELGKLSDKIVVVWQ